MNEGVKDTLLIGDQITLKFKVNVAGGEKYIFPAPQNPVMEGVEMIGAPVTDTIAKKDGVLELESRIVLTSFDSGSYTLPTFFAYKIKSDGTTDTLFFEGGKLEFTTIQIDTTSFKPFDVKGQMNYPYSITEALPWVGIVLLIAAVVLIVTKMVKNLRNKKTIFGKPIVIDPPHITALREIEKIRNEKLWQKNQKEYYTRLTDVLREYIEKRFSIQALEQTSNEILNDLSKEKIEPKIFGELTELLTLSDLVKFAKYSATEQECEASIPASVRFVNSTFLDSIEDMNKKENNKPQEDN